jgi:hypothetical protein
MHVRQTAFSFSGKVLGACAQLYNWLLHVRFASGCMHVKPAPLLPMASIMAQILARINHWLLQLT